MTRWVLFDDFLHLRQHATKSLTMKMVWCFAVSQNYFTLYTSVMPLCSGYRHKALVAEIWARSVSEEKQWHQIKQDLTRALDDQLSHFPTLIDAKIHVRCFFTVLWRLMADQKSVGNVNPLWETSSVHKKRRCSIKQYHEAKFTVYVCITADISI